MFASNMPIYNSVFCAAGAAPSTAQPLIYVAPLPPKFNVDLLYSASRSSEGCHQDIPEHLLGNPTGPLWDRLSPDGPRRTPYFAMEPYVHMQLLNAPFRTLNATEADLVYVPFYVTQLAYSHHRSGCYPVYSELEQASIVASFWNSVDMLLPFLSQKPHWLALAQLEADVANGCGSDWGVSFRCDARAEHFVFTAPEPLAEYEDYRAFKSQHRVHANSIAVPYMGHVHGYVRDLPDAGQLMETKTHLAAMSFTPDHNEYINKLRHKVMADCDERRDSCLFVDLDRAAGVMQQNIPDVLHAYAASWYCSQPAGDTPLRRGVYDCLALGRTLPVFYSDPHVVHHLAFADLIAYRELVTVIGSLADNFFDVLVNTTSMPERIGMITALQRVAHVFQYAVNPSYSLITFEAMHLIEPSDDAFTASVKGVLRNLCSRKVLPVWRCNLSVI